MCSLLVFLLFFAYRTASFLLLLSFTRPSRQIRQTSFFSRPLDSSAVSCYYVKGVCRHAWVTEKTLFLSAKYHERYLDYYPFFQEKIDHKNTVSYFPLRRKKCVDLTNDRYVYRHLHSIEKRKFLAKINHEYNV